MGVGRSLNGVAIGIMAASAFAIYVGINDVPVVEGLRQMLKGETPKGRDPVVTDVEFEGSAGGSGMATGTGAGGAIGGQILAEARKQIGKPYQLGASVKQDKTFDCSSLVVWCINHSGRSVPPAVRRVRDIVRWKAGVTAIPRAQVKPGDLIAWDFVHIGIASKWVGKDLYMVHAPDFGIPVKEAKVWGGVTHYLRVK